MPIAAPTAGNRILATELAAFYSLLKGVLGSGEQISLVYNAEPSVLIQPSTDPAAGTGAIVVKNVAGNVLARLNYDGSLTLNGTTKLGPVPCVSVSKSAGQNFPATTTTLVTFDTEQFDTDTIHDNATNNSRLTCKTAGKYIAVAASVFDEGAVVAHQLKIYKNGVVFVIGGATDYSYGELTSPLMDLAVNDYVEMYVYHNSISSKTATAGFPAGMKFTMHRVGA